MTRTGTVAALALAASLLAHEAHAQERQNVLGFANGTVLLEYTAEYGGRSSSEWIALALIDDEPGLGWASPQNETAPHTFLFEMPQTYTLDSFSLDSRETEEAAYPGVSATGVTISVSASGPDGPFSTAYEGTVPGGELTEITLDAPVEGRWVRMTINGNGGRADYTELMEFSAHGAPAGPLRRPEGISGTYETNWGPFYITVEDGVVRGCYDFDSGRFSGALDGAFLNIEWREEGDQVGQAVMAMTEDGRFLNGFWYEGGSRQGTWFGPLASDATPPDCAAELIAPAKSAVEQALDDTGRAVLHGIYFDLDSDVLKPESEDTLNEVLAWMQAHPDRSVDFAGHTDAQGDDSYNLGLSERRAGAVVAWLASRGIATDRMGSQGFGESQPVADNSSPAGRALNRRVEVALQ